MKRLIDEEYWLRRLNGLKDVLERNNFAVYLATSQSEAKDVVLNEIISQTGAKVISMGGRVPERIRLK